MSDRGVINGYDIMLKMKELIKEHPDTKDVELVLQDEPNDNPSYAAQGWIGIYDNESNYDPNTLGGTDAQGNPVQWEFTASYYILIQYTSFESGQDCAEELHKLEQQVMNILFIDKKIGGLVDQITEVEISYSAVPNFSDEDESDRFYFQQALIKLDVEVDRR